MGCDVDWAMDFAPGYHDNPYGDSNDQKCNHRASTTTTSCSASHYSQYRLCVCEGPTDADWDGYDAIADGGTDCDDSDGSVYPGATEIADDGIDQDCDGADLESSGTVWSDDFEDSSIDTSLWDVDGLSWGSTGGYDTGESSGVLYLEATAATSGITYGGAAWAVTTQDFNDGATYEIAFELDTSGSGDCIAVGIIEITETPYPSVSTGGYYDHDIYTETSDRHLLMSENTSRDPYGGTYCLAIDGSSGFADLYSGSTCSGTALTSVDISDLGAWHLRFMVSAATASGYSAMDAGMEIEEITVTSGGPALSFATSFASGATTLNTSTYDPYGGLVYFSEWNCSTGKIVSIEPSAATAVYSTGSIGTCAHQAAVTSNGYLYVGGYYDSKVYVLDADSLASVTSVSVSSWPGPTTTSADGTAVFHSDHCAGTGSSGSMYEIDSSSHSIATTGSYSYEMNPVESDPGGLYVYGRSFGGEVYVIDASTLSLDTTLSCTTRCGGALLATDNYLYVEDEGSTDAIEVFDVATLTSIDMISTGYAISRIAVDDEESYLFISGDDLLQILDLGTGTLVDTYSVPDAGPIEYVDSGSSGQIFVGTSSGEVYAFDFVE